MDMTRIENAPKTAKGKTKPFKSKRYSLSARLLLLIVSVIMLAELLIFAPSVANFRLGWLKEKLNSAHLAILTLDAAPNGLVSTEMTKELLNHVGAEVIAVRRIGMRQTLMTDMPPTVIESYDLRDPLFFPLIFDAFSTLLNGGERHIRAIGYSSQNMKDEIEVTVSEKDLYQETAKFAGRIFLLSLGISLGTAIMVFVALQWLLVRPMHHITRHMVDFAENPEDENRIIKPGNRKDEIGRAQSELAELQRGLHSMLKQREHLAALGTAVAKINHDLRGILSTALVVSDRLEASEDPDEVRKITPTLINAIDRAANLCTQTLNYVGQDTPPVNPTIFNIAELVHEITNGINGETQILSEIKHEQNIHADRDHLFRVLNNLIRNANEAGAETIRITLEGEDQDFWLLDVEDDGPGLPPRAQNNLFKPFQSSARSGGTGLGLVTARELIRAQGGDLWLLETGENGTVFRIHLPHHMG